MPDIADAVSETIENAYDAETRKTRVWFDGQTLSRVLVDDRQHTKGTAVCQRVTDKVHGPTLVCLLEVCRCGGGKPLPTVPTLASSHRQPELSIHSVEPVCG